MSTIRKVLVGGAVGLAVVVPAGLAAAGATNPPDDTPICTTEQREERQAVRDELRTQILEQLRQEGVTDPVELRDQLRIRLHDALEARFGELPGPYVGAGLGGEHMGGRQLGPMDGTGNRVGPNR